MLRYSILLSRVVGTVLVILTVVYYQGFNNVKLEMPSQLLWLRASKGNYPIHIAQKLNKTAVMTRCMHPLAGAVARIADWRSSLPKEVDFWVQVDNSTGGANADFKTIRSGLSDPDSVEFSAFTVEQMTERFPSLSNLLDRHHLDSVGASISWGFHIEALNLWYEIVRPRKHYDYVWIIECDVGFSGKLGDFVGNMTSRNEDLLLPYKRVMNSSWPFYNTATPAFAQIAPNTTDRIYGAEQFQRISAKLFDILLDWSSRGVSAWSEMSTPTAVKYYNLTDYELTPYFDINQMDWDKRVSREEWKRIMQSTDPDVVNHFYHALKW
mmetsp:Transcript_2133/g.4064  ORF Transcript_2133/g.4064 Transcript_2133/m.4064 type:complete len:324 (-) Transcript_2133:281-1252(-)